MQATQEQKTSISPWLKHGLILALVVGFSLLIWMSVSGYNAAPPIPEKVVDSFGDTVFTKDDILNGQQVFLSHGLMQNGSIWGHGAYLGPDFTAEYLYTLTDDCNRFVAKQEFKADIETLSPSQQAAVNSRVITILKENTYDAETGILTFSDGETFSFQKQIQKWGVYFKDPEHSRGLPREYIKAPDKLKALTSFFAWTAWASVTNRPGESYTYTNNFPYAPESGNTPPVEVFIWSALSLIALLGGIAAILFIFGKFGYLGWKGKTEHIHPQMLPGVATESQRATIKYFVIVTILFLLQTLIGGAVAHYRIDPGGFYGLDITGLFPSHLLRTWHLQLAIFWIATALVGGGLLLSSAIGGHEPKGQVKGINILFGLLVVVVGGSLLGELLGVNQLLGDLWFWIGHQGWEYLDLGRAWQVLLAGALVFWLFLLYRAVSPALRDPASRDISYLFIYAAIAIPLFYIPAMFYGPTTHFTVVDTWRFWIIHLWVEGFFELFVTVMVALIFFKLGIITQLTATRLVYLDAILYLGSGLVGTGHHWYWTGHSTMTMALAAMFSALEVVPLTLLTLDAWDFIKLTRSKCDVCGKSISVPHKWTFYFLMAVGFWNFVGAGIFGFLINMPIVSYYEVGTLLTTNHGHAAMIGVFGMLSVALAVFAFRHVLTEEQWVQPEKYIRISFWGLNIGLAAMIVLNLFPGGVLQMISVFNNGYRYARSGEFLSEKAFHIIEWMRFPGDIIIIVFGVMPLVYAAILTYTKMKSEPVG